MTDVPELLDPAPELQMTAPPELNYRDPNNSGEWTPYHDDDKVDVAGDTMTGNLTMSGSAGVAFPTGNTSLYQDGSGLHVLDAALAAYRPLSLLDPTLAVHAATKNYVDTTAGGKRVVTVISASQAAGSAAKTDYVYIASAALTLTLPTAVGSGSVYTVKRSGTGTVTIATTSGQTIDGAASLTIEKQWASVDIISDNTNWVVINPNEVAISAAQPTDPAVELWLDPAGTWANEFATKAYVDGGGWITPTLLNSWVDYGGTYAGVGYQKVGRVVYMKGLVTGGAAGTVIFNLPAGYRPSSQMLMLTAVNATPPAGRIDVYTNGNLLAGTAGWVSIDLSFIADA